MTRKAQRIVKELLELAEDADFHPMHRALFKDSADLILEQESDLDGYRKQGSDHG